MGPGLRRGDTLWNNRRRGLFRPHNSFRCIEEQTSVAQARLSRSEQISGWAFIAPALVLLSIFMIYPIIWSLWMSFQVGKGMNFSFGGFTNIIRLTKDPVFIRALTNTCIFLVVQVPIMIVLALLFANALNDPTLRFRGL